MSRYLYGASVQGIQNFIFQTDKLREIAGASELVQNAVTDLFAKKIGAKDLKNDPNAIVNAAGKVSYIFDDEKRCRDCVRDFPLQVMNSAPGITVSQAVVAMTGEFTSYEAASKELERRLKAQRNHPTSNSLTTGIMGIARSRQTGVPAVETMTSGDRKGQPVDAATVKKLDAAKLRVLCVKAFGEDAVREKSLPYEIEEITGINNWVAVIHADGNGLGKVVSSLKGEENKFKEFSTSVEDATVKSAREAFLQVRDMFNEAATIPIRPVVLGGDDFTVICRGDIAIDYVTAFIRAFEVNSKSIVPEGLTACAGVSFIKASFPFHYGYDLAESLCDEAKKVAKCLRQEKNLGQIPSCLMFHKVQDSFVESYDKIKDDQLSVDGGGTFCFGPYFLDETSGYYTIDKLLESVDKLSGSNGPGEKEAMTEGIRSGIRKWISSMHYDKGLADQLLSRMIQNNQWNKKAQTLIKELTASEPVRNAYAAANILDLDGIITKKTK